MFRALLSTYCIFNRIQTPWYALDCATDDASIFDGAAGDLEGCRDIDQCKIPDIAIGHFLKIELGVGPGIWNPDGGQNFTFVQHRHVGDISRRSDKEVLRRNQALTADTGNHHGGIQGDQSRRGVRRAHRDTATGAEQGMLTIQAFGRICIADVAAGAITIQAAPIVPAASILNQVAAEGTYVADLGAGNPASGRRQQCISGLNQGIGGNFSNCGNRANLDPVCCFLDSFPGIDLGKFDHRSRGLIAVF